MKRLWILALCAACASSPPTTEVQRQELHELVQSAITVFQRQNPGAKRFFEESHGYVVFPRIGKGGFLFGGGAGDGVVYERGERIGWAGISLVSFGALIGGGRFSQIIFFETKAHLDAFKDGVVEFGAGVNAIAYDKHIGLNTPFRRGMAVFVFNAEGLMADASGSKQEFQFLAK